MGYINPDLIHRVVNGVVEKQCSGCKDWFPETTRYFYRNGSVYFRSCCKVCSSFASDEQYRKHRLSKLKHRKEAYHANIVESREQQNRYRINRAIQKYKKAK